MAYNYITQHNSPSFTGGRGGKKIEFIIIHWWDDPSKNPSFEGVINTLTNPARQASAHFVATGTNRRVACLVDLPETAWHAGNFDANQRSIGIECDPRCRDEDYDVVAELVCELRAIYGNLPLRRHSEFSSTQCPGNYDLARIDRESKNKVYNGTFGKTTNITTLPVPNAIKFDKPQLFTMNFDGVNLWKLDTNPNYQSAKTFQKGEEFEAYGYIPFNNTKYLVTEYSFSKGIKNGVNVVDLTRLEPILEPKPTEPINNPEKEPEAPETPDNGQIQEPKPTEPIEKPTKPEKEEPKDEYDDVEKVGEEINKQINKSWFMRILSFIINLIIKAITR